MQMWREPIPQLTSIRGQIQRNLSHLIHHHPPRTLVPTVALSALQLLTLAYTRDDGPHDEVRDVDGDGLGEAGEFGSVGADDGGVALGIQGEDFEAADALGRC